MTKLNTKLSKQEQQKKVTTTAKLKIWKIITNFALSL